jgi:hypothetical protein
MKPLMLLLASSVLFAAPAAYAQGQGDGCSNQYSACMDHCSSRPPSAQEQCSQMCENNTNRCYVGLYGQSPQGGQAPQGVAATPAPAPSSEASEAHGEATPGEAKPAAK